MTGMQQFILGLASTVIAAVSGYLLHRRSKLADATSAQSGAASNHRAGTQQVIEGLNQLLDQAQETIKESRVVIKEDREAIALLEGTIATFVTERAACRTELAVALADNARLRKQYGVADA